MSSAGGGGGGAPLNEGGGGGAENTAAVLGTEAGADTRTVAMGTEAAAADCDTAPGTRFERKQMRVHKRGRRTAVMPRVDHGGVGPEAGRERRAHSVQGAEVQRRSLLLHRQRLAHLLLIHACDKKTAR